MGSEMCIRDSLSVICTPCRASSGSVNSGAILQDTGDRKRHFLHRRKHDAYLSPIVLQHPSMYLDAMRYTSLKDRRTLPADAASMRPQAQVTSQSVAGALRRDPPSHPKLVAAHRCTAARFAAVRERSVKRELANARSRVNNHTICTEKLPARPGDPHGFPRTLRRAGEATKGYR